MMTYHNHNDHDDHHDHANHDAPRTPGLSQLPAGDVGEDEEQMLAEIRILQDQLQWLQLRWLRWQLRDALDPGQAREVEPEELLRAQSHRQTQQGLIRLAEEDLGQDLGLYREKGTGMGTRRGPPCIDVPPPDLSPSVPAAPRATQRHPAATSTASAPIAMGPRGATGCRPLRQ